jgi:hypothetical protein
LLTTGELGVKCERCSVIFTASRCAGSGGSPSRSRADREAHILLGGQGGDQVEELKTAHVLATNSELFALEVRDLSIERNAAAGRHDSADEVDSILLNPMVSESP